MDLSEMRAHLGSRVKGQDHVLDDLCPFLAERLKQPRDRGPLAGLCFIGAPATGKTTLANALAQYLCGEERALSYRFEEFLDPEAHRRLVGYPAGRDLFGAKGHESLLTKPLIENPRRVLRFQYFERFDKSFQPILFQMLTEGKLRDAASGQIADFSQSVVILTSAAERSQYNECFIQIPDHAEATKAVIEWWANPKERPEAAFRSRILRSVDRTYVFWPLSDRAKVEILAIRAAEWAKIHGLELAGIDSRFLADLVAQDPGGIRGCLGNLDRFSDHQFEAAKRAGWRNVRIDLAEQGPVVSQVPQVPIEMAEIVVRRMVAVAGTYGLDLAYVDPKILFNAIQRGTRELDRMIVDMIGAHFMAARRAGGKRVRLDIEEDGVTAISPADYPRPPTATRG